MVSRTLCAYIVIPAPDKFIRGQAPAGIQPFNGMDSRLRGNDDMVCGDDEGDYATD